MWPYSYFGFLEKAVRPTNMARWRIAWLPDFNGVCPL
jgi:hypothetical protein